MKIKSALSIAVVVTSFSVMAARCNNDLDESSAERDMPTDSEMGTTQDTDAPRERQLGEEQPTESPDPRMQGDEQWDTQYGEEEPTEGFASPLPDELENQQRIPAE